MRFVLPLTGGMHQALHLLPVAATLNDRGHAVDVVTMDGATAGFAHCLFAACSGNRIALEQLAAGVAEGGIAKATGRREPNKSLRLFERRARLVDADALIRPQLRHGLHKSGRQLFCVRL